MKKGYLIVGIALSFALLFTQKGLTDDEFLERKLTRIGQKYVPGEIIVKFKPGVKEDVIANVISRHKAEVFYTSPFAGFKRIRIPRAETVSEMVERFRRDPNVEYAEPNYIAYAFWVPVPNDPYYKYQWHMDNPIYGGINTEEAWQLTSGDPSVIVAVIDTGVAYEDYTQTVGWRKVNYYRAPDLAQTSFVPGYDFVNDDTHPNDDNSHGTHVTGTIAQSTNNGIGVVGVAFSCSIMPVKVLNKYGSGTYADVADGIRFAADKGAKVINLSLGGSSDSATLKDAVAYAYNKGATIVCASGNDGSPDTISYPAAYDDYCIAVGATRYDEAVTYYSNRGPSLDLVAPGGDLNVDQNGDGYADGVLQQTFGNTTNDWGYWFYEGTSMAVPHVSGVAALLISYRVASTPDEVKVALQSTAEDHGLTRWDPEYGWGLVDAYAALKWTPGPDTTPPVVSNGKPTDIINNNTPMLSVTTNEPATCKGSINVDKEYVDMGLEFQPDAASTTHTYQVPVASALADGSHTVYVKGKDTAGNITSTSYSWSFTVDTTAPAQVQGVSVDTISSSELKISWTNNIERDLDHYNIYRSTTSGFVPSSDNLIASLTATSYSDKGLSPSTTYYYRVTAVDKAGNEGVASDEVSGTTAEAPAEIEVFSDSFEVSEWSGLWTEDSQNDWFRSIQRAVDGGYSAEVDGYASNAQLISIPIDLEGRTSAIVTFSWYIESSLDTGEYLAFDITTNGGTTWVEKARLKGNVDPENAWHNVNINLTGITSLGIRFRGKMSGAEEDANVDMVKVTAK